MSETLAHGGKTFVLSEEGYKGKKAFQVAKIIEALQEQPGVPLDFEELCLAAGQKYPQDLIAAAMAFEMTELVDVYKQASGDRKKMFLVWKGPVNPTEGSDAL